MSGESSVGRPKIGRRISVRGTSGSGKTTLGRELSHVLDIPHIEIDALYHLPDWHARPKEEFRGLVSEIVEGEAWIVDGNYSSVSDLVLSRADTVIWLTYPLPIVLWRLTRRIWRRALWREVLWQGNREHLWRHYLTKDSLYLWVFKSYRRIRQRADDFMSDPANAHVTCYRFRSPKEAKEWLEGFRVIPTSPNGAIQP